MGWWPFGRGRGERLGARDYYREAVELAEEGKHHEALTSFRLALRQRPGDVDILQQMAMVYTRIGMFDEAIRFYSRAIEADEAAPGAHYGLAFLLLRQGDAESARSHLEAFLANPPGEESARAHIEHARTTLRALAAEAASAREPPVDAPGEGESEPRGDETRRDDVGGEGE